MDVNIFKRNDEEYRVEIHGMLNENKKYIEEETDPNNKNYDFKNYCSKKNARKTYLKRTN